jgi:hypothetical protein
MIDKGRRANFYKSIYSVCFFLLVGPVAAMFFWIMFALLASGTPIPRIIVLRIALLVMMIAALLGYFKWPWVAALVGWADMVMVFTGMFAWEEPGLENLLYQFSLDLLFFAAAHVGLACFLLSKRIPQART